MKMIAALVILIGLTVLAAFSWSEQGRTKVALEEQRGWRVVITQEGLRYEEKKDGALCSIVFPREDIEPGVWYCRFPSEAQWHAGPHSFLHRQQEIIAKVRAEFPEVAYADEMPIQPPEPTPGRVI
jgi:hypothetical protein